MDLDIFLKQACHLCIATLGGLASKLSGLFILIWLVTAVCGAPNERYVFGICLFIARKRGLQWPLSLLKRWCKADLLSYARIYCQRATAKKNHGIAMKSSKAVRRLGLALGRWCQLALCKVSGPISTDVTLKLTLILSIITQLYT